MSGAQAFREYYLKHADRVKARVERYRANDPTGRKKRERKMAKLTFQYRKKPSLKLAIKIYAVGHLGQKQPKFWRIFIKEVTDYARSASTLPYITR